MLRSSFNVETISGNTITIRDMANSQGTMSVTNDAESVVEYIHDSYKHVIPENMRILYWDTDDDLSELKHDNGRFIGFAPI